MQASRELRTVRFLYNSLQFLVVEQNPVWNNTAVHPTWENENIIVQRTGVSLSFFPFPLGRNKENGNT